MHSFDSDQARAARPEVTSKRRAPMVWTIKDSVRLPEALNGKHIRNSNVVVSLHLVYHR